MAGYRKAHWWIKAKCVRETRTQAVGYDGVNMLNDFWEYDPSTNTWTQKANFGGTARSGAVGLNICSKGHIGTGYDGVNRLNDFWEYDPLTNIWTQKANFGGTARYGAVGFSIGSKGYIGTGYDGANRLNDFWEYEPLTNTWTQKANFGGTARSVAVGFSIGSKGYIGTGYNGIPLVTDVVRYIDFWEYSPANTRITTGAFSAGPYCPGSSITVPFTIGCNAFSAGNIFTAQLSDSIGSFSNPVNMATISATSTQIVATIPAVISSSSNYLVRVVGSDPETFGISSPDAITVNQRNKTIGSGNWKDISIWSCGHIPSINDSAIISSGHIVNFDSTAQVGKMTIENNGSVIMDNPTVVFTIGAESDKLSPVICNGSLDIVNGSLKINGNLEMTNSGRFNMRGGELVIDGNTGDSATSVPNGQHLFNISTSCSNFNFTGGTLRLINPPLGTNSQAINCSYNFGILSTTYFGDGVSTIRSNNVNGFGGNLLPAKIGKLIFDPATAGNNRIFKNLNPLTVFKEFKILSGNIEQSALLQVVDSTGANIVTDIDGNIYTTITIGTQVWLAENLKTSRYKNGDPIPTGLSDTQWHITTTGAYSIYDDNCINNDKFGKLYNWYAVTDPRGIAPEGWHVPSDSEWNILINYLGGPDIAGGPLKAVSPLWNSPNNGATNSSGFTALPGGGRDDGKLFNATVNYGGLGEFGYWWTTTENNNPVETAKNHSAYSNYIYSYPGYASKGYGFSVRCIKN